MLSCAWKKKDCCGIRKARLGDKRIKISASRSQEVAVSGDFISCLAVDFLICRLCERCCCGRCQLGEAAWAPLRSDTEGVSPGKRRRSCLPFHQRQLQSPVLVQPHGFYATFDRKYIFKKASDKQNIQTKTVAKNCIFHSIFTFVPFSFAFNFR